MRHHAVASRSKRPSAAQPPRRWASIQASRSASEPKEDLPQLIRRLVQYGWSYDRIRRRVEQRFPPPAPTPVARLQHRERIARLIVRYRHGESVSSGQPE